MTLITGAPTRIQQPGPAGTNRRLVAWSISSPSALHPKQRLRASTVEHATRGTVQCEERGATYVDARYVERGASLSSGHPRRKHRAGERPEAVRRNPPRPREGCSSRSPARTPRRHGRLFTRPVRARVRCERVVHMPARVASLWPHRRSRGKDALEVSRAESSSRHLGAAHLCRDSARELFAERNTLYLFYIGK